MCILLPVDSSETTRDDGVPLSESKKQSGCWRGPSLGTCAEASPYFLVPAAFITDWRAECCVDEEH